MTSQIPGKVNVQNRICIQIQNALLQLLQKSVNLESGLCCGVGGKDHVHVGKGLHKLALGSPSDSHNSLLAYIRSVTSKVSSFMMATYSEGHIRHFGLVWVQPKFAPVAVQHKFC